MSGKPRPRFLLCDLDNTLYPADSGIMPAMGRLIHRYMVERVGIPLQEAELLKRQYYAQYGATMLGLMRHHAVDPEDYLGYVHDLPLEQYIQPNPDLDIMLARIPLRKVVFTNSDREHAGRVLDTLSVRHRFERIIDVYDLGFNPKPHRSAYLRALAILSAQAGECIIVEDVAPNLVPAKRLGMVSVLVGDGSSPSDSPGNEADVHIPDILNLADAIYPWIRGL